jgi:hypothetical protein
MTRDGKGARVVEHSVQGVLTIRLIEPPPAVVENVKVRLGASGPHRSPEPDLVVRFRDEPRDPATLRFLDLNGAAFDDQHFYVLDGDGNSSRIDFRALGGPMEIVCTRGISAIPFLESLVGLGLLAKGLVLLHASAFVWDGKGVLAAGWRKGGKTELLLGFMAAGADYVADEWTIVSPGERSVLGLQGVVQIWSWQLRYVPAYWARIGRRQRLRIRLVRLYQHVYGIAPQVGRRLPYFLRRLAAEGGNARLGQARSSPAELFGDRVWDGKVGIDHVFLATAAEGETRVREIDPGEITERMVASLAYERRHLLAAYDQFRFAFPDRKSVFLENAESEERRLLSLALAGTSAYELLHPYPVPLDELHSACLPFVGDR